MSKISYLLNCYQDYLDTREQFPDMQNGTCSSSHRSAHPDHHTTDNKGRSEESVRPLMMLE